MASWFRCVDEGREISINLKAVKWAEKEGDSCRIHLGYITSLQLHGSAAENFWKAVSPNASSLVIGQVCNTVNVNNQAVGEGNDAEREVA